MKKHLRKDIQTRVDISTRLLSECSSNQDSFQIIRYDNRKGILIRATALIPAGSILCIESPFATILRGQFRNKFCHCCFQRRILVGCKCLLCSEVHYCSEECQKAHYEFHRLQCSVLQSNLIHIAQINDCDVDLLFLLLNCITCLFIISQSKDVKLINSWSFVQNLQSHEDKFDMNWRQVVTKSCSDLYQRLPVEMQSICDVETLERLARIVNTNSFGLTHPEGLNSDIGVGIFPCISLYCHSCSPNVYFSSGKAGEMKLRAIRDIPIDSEICVSYIDIYASRFSRQATLSQTKHFQCKCTRCIEPIESSLDRFLDGVICPKCLKDVLIKSSSDTDTHSCVCCSFSCPSSNIEEVVSRALQIQNTAIDAKNHNNLQKARELFDALISEFSVRKTSKKGNSVLYLHRNHEILFNTYPSLFNITLFQKDYLAASRYCHTFLDLMDGFFPEYHPEPGIFQFALAELCNEALLRNPAFPTAIRNRFRQDLIHSITHCVKIRKVAFGDDHIICIAAQEMLNQYIRK